MHPQIRRQRHLPFARLLADLLQQLRNLVAIVLRPVGIVEVTPAVIHVEGDPEHPINRGTLCPKGATLRDDINNPNRLLKPQVRRPGSDHWEDISWDDAFKGIARHIKDTRDRTFMAKNAKGQVVNRTPGIAMIGGCTDTNEFNYLQWKVITALGVPYRDSQARL